MRHLRHITFLDVAPVAAELAAFAPERPDPARDISFPGLLHKSIILRCHPSPNLDNWLEDRPVDDWPIFAKLPALHALIEDARRQIDPEAPLGRVCLSVIEPGGFIQPHTDLGVYARAHQRYHIPLHTNPQALIYALGRFGLRECAHLPQGALAWLDTQVIHGAENGGGAHRTHALFELRQ